MHNSNSPPNRRNFLGMTAAALAAPCLARANTALTERIEGRAFGTTWQISAPSGAGLDQLRAEVTKILADIDRQMSPWRPDSDISSFNVGAAGSYRVSPDTVTVVQAALELAGLSNGHFDPSLGPLVARWGFGPIAGDTAHSWKDLSSGSGRISKAHPGLTLDLCGIAKGFALDRIAWLARDSGQDSLLIDIGGELIALGMHPAGRPWQVAVENPMVGSSGAAALLGLSDRAVATSGLHAQSYGPTGAEYGHIIDPGTGAPARGPLRSVSVLAPDAMTADGWATALFAAGATDGPALARAHGVSALFLSESAGRTDTTVTGDFAEVLQ